LDIEKKLFETWHAFTQNPTEELYTNLKQVAEELKAFALAAPTDNKKCENIAKIFADFPGGYTSFVDNQGVEPTNNEAERSFRFLAIIRRISFGTGSEAGRRAREKLWTTYGTCRKQKKSLFHTLPEPT
jgi:hypothetical protein